jgi:hypothetical protein
MFVRRHTPLYTRQGVAGPDMTAPSMLSLHVLPLLRSCSALCCFAVVFVWRTKQNAVWIPAGDGE